MLSIHFTIMIARHDSYNVRARWVLPSELGRHVVRSKFSKSSLPSHSLFSPCRHQNWNRTEINSDRTPCLLFLSLLQFFICIFFHLNDGATQTTPEFMWSIEKKRIRSIPTCVVLCLLRIGLNVKYTSCLKHLFSYFPTDCCCTPRLMTTKTPVQSSTQLSLYVLIVNKC